MPTMGKTTNNKYMFENYYSILNIHQGAKLSEIKEAFRKLALQNHPDINGV